MNINTKIFASIIGLLLILLLCFACDKQQSSPTAIDEPATALEKRNYQIELIMPDKVPDIINEKALDLAYENKYENIRILKIKDEKGNKWHIQFFENDLTEIESYVCDVDSSRKNPISIQKIDKSTEVNLKKTAWYCCWRLATVYKDANWSGSSFQFSQGTTSTGYFHKVIWNLHSSQACCAATFPGGFNDCISSHVWISDKFYMGPYAHPVSLKMWEHANRNGSSKSWAVNWNGSYQQWETYTSNYASYGWNDRVSSIDMFYKVSYSIQ